MNSRFNSRLINRGPSQGNVAGYFDRLKELINVNDGTRSFVLKTVDCHDQAAPFSDAQETRIAITHSDHDISQISDGFLTFKITLNLQLVGIDKNNFEDLDHLCKIFVGFKSSNQILDQLQVLCNNISTDYQQNECCREGFAYSTVKPKVDKKTKKYTHSLYENVSYYSPSVCGTYINVADFKDGQPHTVTFEVNLPFDDILCLQAFDMFPNAIVGDIELKFYVKPRGLVWCMIDPMKVKESKEFFEGDDINFVSDKNLSAMFRHAFTQIGNDAEMINAFKYEVSNVGGQEIKNVIAEKGNVKLICNQLTVQSLKSNMYGFNVVPSTLSHIAEIFSTPQYIPAQQLDYNAFPISATGGGIQSTINMPVTNCCCISIMFPKHDNDYTIFENPIYQNLQLTVNGRNMPDEVVDSTGARFLQQMLIASDLDGGLECTKEFEDSIVMDRNTSDGTRYVNCLADGTSFMWNVQCERGNAGYTFDGIDSNGQNIPIQIKGNPKYTGLYDTYYNVTADGTVHPPPPQIWLCRDTYWLASTNGLKYVGFSTPDDKQVLQ